MGITFSGFFHVAVTLLFSVITLGLAISFASGPTEKKLRILTRMSWATLFSILAAVAAGIGAMALHASLAEGGGGPNDLARQIMGGLEEAMVVPVFGFVVLALAWLLAAVGLRRQD